MTPVPPGIPRRPSSGDVPRVPLERGRAAGILAGLLLFGLGFVLSGAVAWSGRSGGPLYLTCVAIGFFGVGCVAYFLNRGTVPLPEGKPIWSRPGLGMLATALQMPAVAVIVPVYGLVALGVIGNIILPLALR